MSHLPDILLPGLNRNDSNELRRIRIFVVDQNASVRDLFRQQLLDFFTQTEIFAEVFAYPDGSSQTIQDIRSILGGEPARNVLLTDARMNSGDRNELVIGLREYFPKSENLRIAIISVMSRDHLRDSGFEALLKRSDAYIGKELRMKFGRKIIEDFAIERTIAEFLEKYPQCKIDL